MQLEETIAKELADIINGQVSHCQAQINQLVTATAALTKAVAGLQVDEMPPPDIIDDISKAVALLAEAPPLTQARDSGPVVVQFTPPLGKRVKTITTRRDDKGNLVARVVED